jgi:hypothetical protein
MKIRLYLLPWVATISFAQSTVTAPVGGVFSDLLSTFA